jgi:transcriptional regulator with XRE-family HTH domain
MATEGLGDALRRLRKSLGLTQEAVAKSSHLSRTYVSQIERGHKVPPAETLRRVARALDADPRPLLRAAGHAPDKNETSTTRDEVLQALRRSPWLTAELRDALSVLYRHVSGAGGRR